VQHADDALALRGLGVFLTWRGGRPGAGRRPAVSFFPSLFGFAVCLRAAAAEKPYQYVEPRRHQNGARLAAVRPLQIWLCKFVRVFAQA